MIGDFNDIAVASEQRGGTFSPSRATAFVEGYESCGMMDLGSFGLTYTWYRHAQGRPPLHRRLDRALANVDWRLGFPNGSVEVLPRMHSDHSPLLLRCCPPPPGIANKPFRFEAAWMDHPQYATVVSGAWEKGGPNFVSSLDCVRQDSLLFNQEVFGNIFRRKRRIADQIRRVQERLETVDSAYLHRRLGELRKDQEEVLAHEEMLWFQKSREKWVRYGDRNTSFFHAQTIIRRRRNHIQGLELPDGSWCTDGEVLREEVRRFYLDLFATREEVDIACAHTPSVTMLPPRACATLSATVGREEVTTAIYQMGSFKAPGPDGFQACFYKRYWEVVGDSVFEFVADAFRNGNFDPHIAETLIVLIPKVDNPRSCKELRPVSLCNVSHKLITKILVNRIRPYLSNLISPFQSSFIPGRGTTDNAIVLQEVVHLMMKTRRRVGDLIFKLDLEKAYDRVDWRFLEDTLRVFGFPEDCIRLIMFCVTSVQLSVLWNGDRLPTFNPRRGLRQGDPLSPYLFVLCMERLSAMISAAVSDGRWLPVTVAGTNFQLSHLMFADDLLLFTRASEEQVGVMRDVLYNFCKASGMRVSVAKSRVMGHRSIQSGFKDQVTAITGISFTLDIGKYLGFPIFSKRATNRVWTSLGLRVSVAHMAVEDPMAWLRQCLLRAEFTTLAAVWGIWVARNKVVIEQHVMTEWELVAWIMQLKTTFERAWGKPASTRPAREVAWIPPGEDEVAVNCDGSRGAARNSSGYGGCLRDASGRWLGGFMGFGKDASVLAMELLAIFRGLRLAWDRGFRRVVCYSDSLLAVSLILRPPSMFHEHAGLISSICGLLRREWSVRVLHTLREGNACADCLAKAGAGQLLEFLVVVDPPAELQQLLLADALGISFLRP
ncbi:uncharacterized protein LOC130737157 [Lotus japonicus]|uniref:uncharacterized protein LOC130737157 n=1 Tax=Lotus japonicus TaxID=34305 RepID=UPI002588D313|nr:uncharacterized protein LOC130737157 [Lotus japonicus]